MVDAGQVLSKLLAKRPAQPTTALDLRREGPAPAAVEVYLLGHAAMLPALRAVVVLLGAAPADNPDAATAAVRVFPWEGLHFEHVEAIRAKLVATYAPATARLYLTAVRGVLRTAWKLGRIDRDAFERAVDVDPIAGDGVPAGRMLSREEIARLFTTCSPIAVTSGTRDGALLALALYAGLRRVELVRLDLADLYGAKVIVRKGKGRKYREVFLPDVALARIETWLDERGRAPGPLFPRHWRGGHAKVGSRLSVSGVGLVITEAAHAAGIEVTPHDFRRTFASTLFDAGIDPVTVQGLMGHADPATTARYDRRGDERKQRAADALAGAFGPLGDP
jgi:integrase